MFALSVQYFTSPQVKLSRFTTCLRVFPNSKIDNQTKEITVEARHSQSLLFVLEADVGIENYKLTPIISCSDSNRASLLSGLQLDHCSPLSWGSYLSPNHSNNFSDLMPDLLFPNWSRRSLLIAVILNILQGSESKAELSKL
jgi:hypothetical protein